MNENNNLSTKMHIIALKNQMISQNNKTPWKSYKLSYLQNKYNNNTEKTIQKLFKILFLNIKQS